MSERPTQNELDEANASHAQDAEEQEVLRDKWKMVDADCRDSGLITYHVDAFDEAAKLRAKGAATIAQLKRLHAMEQDMRIESEKQIASLKAQLAEAQKIPSAINSCPSRAYEEAIGYVDGFNACRKLWISAAPTYKKE